MDVRAPATLGMRTVLLLPIMAVPTKTFWRECSESELCLRSRARITLHNYYTRLHNISHLKQTATHTRHGTTHTSTHANVGNVCGSGVWAAPNQQK